MHVAVKKPKNIADEYVIGAARGKFESPELVLCDSIDGVCNAIYEGQAQIGVARAYDHQDAPVRETFLALLHFGVEYGILDNIVSEVPGKDKRLAVLGRGFAEKTGYDSTYLALENLRDKPGLLHCITGALLNPRINMSDIHKITDDRGALHFYIELEGHIQDEEVQAALQSIASRTMIDSNQIKVLGSYPRIDTSKKLISTVGFIGRGEMAKWYKAWLEQEGIKVELTGTTSDVSAMIERNQVIGVCVPITKTPGVIQEYVPQLEAGQTLIEFSGEKVQNLLSAQQLARPGVYVGGIHTLWGPALDISSLNQKKVEIVRTEDSGPFFDEIVNLFYKYGAMTLEVNATEHDRMMGFTQKLPHAAVVALVWALRESGTMFSAIKEHTTPTSDMLFDLAGRIHDQSLAVYPDILASNQEGDLLLKSFCSRLEEVRNACARRDVETLKEIMAGNQQFLGKKFTSGAKTRTKKYDAITAEDDYDGQ